MTNKLAFWIVWNPQGATPPRVMHKSRGEAESVAKKMANDFPGEEFIVMESGKGFRAVTMEMTDYSDIPF